MIDSLTIAFLTPLLVGAGAPELPAPPGHSIVITWTVEVSETLTIERAGTSRLVDEVVRYPKRFHTTTYVASAAANPGDAATLATRWGLGGLSGHTMGYASVEEHTLTRGWAFRVGVIRGYNSDREREIRWSLVHGVL